MPVLKASIIREHQVEQILKQSLTASEWSEVFADIENAILPSCMTDVGTNIDEIPNTSVNELALAKLSILSPTKARPDHGLFLSHPTLSFESADSNSSSGGPDGRELVDPKELLLYTEKINQNINKFKESWTKPFIDVDSDSDSWPMISRY